MSLPPISHRVWNTSQRTRHRIHIPLQHVRPIGGISLDNSTYMVYNVLHCTKYIPNSFLAGVLLSSDCFKCVSLCESSLVAEMEFRK